MPASKSVQKKSEPQQIDTKKTTKTSKTTEPVKEETVPVQTDKKETKSRQKKVVEPSQETSSSVVENTTTATNKVVAETTTEQVDVSVSDNFSEFISKFQAMISQFSSLKSELRVLERKTVKQLKVVQKLNQKKKRKGTRAPSGFVKPAPISNELADFLGKPQGSEMARTDVTREINKYIRANNLQDKENGRKINPDKNLCQLLKIDNEIILTYFNLQRYMGPHFPKQVKEVKVEIS
jgi:chromatin remodeling complex protein RSC6